MRPTISNKQFSQIYEHLLSHTDQTIADMWKYGNRVVLSDEYDVAALELAEGGYRIVANKNLWRRLSVHERTFVVCHELLHVLFCHWAIPYDMETEWANIAQDIQVNEYIKSRFPRLFASTKKSVPRVCIESVFKHKEKLVFRNQNYPYYYDVLMRCLS